jgi:aminopeptidase N
MKTEHNANPNPNMVYLKDYRQPDFVIESVDLTFKLHEDGALVTSVLKMSRTQPDSTCPLVLDGEDLELGQVSIDGRILAVGEYEVGAEKLTIAEVPDRFVFACETWIKPQENKRLEGLYRSSKMFCTQCEAEGFRRITYYLDRPDVMSVFRTRIEADAKTYPVLLSNGNPVESGSLPGGRHFVTWEDPFRKPCYLFALVAGDLHCQKDRFTTMSGRDIDLRIYVDPQNADKCDFALEALKRAMRWDEEVYGREYDLDIFMIVAVDDFNMGAMENKGLNIFNSSCVLAKRDATTDAGFERIEAIVAHEYFHNWSGNRVTCRDWFQLSLKEGFTVFRDAEFSADMGSRTVKRIDDVNLLRTAQFAEDAGPMSHPVRPASYLEVSNFYTLTIYEKGAEVVRMLHTLLGPKLFRQGSDLYFERHDGQAVTTDDFVAAMEAVSGRDLTQFKRWYEQAGTPEVRVTALFDNAAQRYTLTFVQSCPATPGQPEKQPYHMPISLALFNSDGQPVPLAQAGGGSEWVFELTERTQSLVFDGLDRAPVPSLLRGFSAPVKLHFEYSDDDLLFLMKHDTDGFNRWDANQRLSLRVLEQLIKAAQTGRPLVLPQRFVEVMGGLLRDTTLDEAMVCKLLTLPSESYLVELATCADVVAIHQARSSARSTLAEQLRSELVQVYRRCHRPDEDVDLGFAAMARRALKNAVLNLLAAAPDAQFFQLAQTQFATAGTMTDQFGALQALVNSGANATADEVLTRFHEQWQQDRQVVEQWFSVQAASTSFADLARIRALMQHPDFEFTNPNKLRSVVGMFCNQNLLHFHAPDGQAYHFLADQIIRLDDLNPQIASRLLTPLTRWRKFDPARQVLMKEQLRRVAAKPELSKDVREVVERSLD